MSPAELQIDLLDGELYANDPSGAYAHLRDDAPAYWDAQNEIWGISRHADIVEIEKKPHLFCSRHGFRPKMLGGDTSMIGRDDPEHLRQRKVLHRQFMPRRIAGLEPRIRATATELIDRMLASDAPDLVRDLAIPLPVITIIEMLGFERERWPELARWSEITNSAGGGPRYHTPEVMPCVEAFFAETAALIAERREQPREDLISLLVADARDTGRSDADLCSEALLLLNGGSDTTRHVIGGATLELLRHPGQWDFLRANPRAIPTAVEEFIRWVSPLLNMRRTATRDTRLHGRDVREGDEVLLMFAAANRDPAVFDGPERFDVRRRPNPHLGFGFGTHFCLGASLARLELRVVFEELLQRVTALRTPADFEPSWIPNAFTRGLSALPIERAN